MINSASDDLTNLPAVILAYSSTRSLSDRTSCIAWDSAQSIQSAVDIRFNNDWIVHPYPMALSGITPAKPRYGIVPIGEIIWTVGIPDGRVGGVSMGIVSYQNLGVYYIDARTLPGSSGGGVFDEKGRLIGIVSGLTVVEGIGPITDAGIVVQIPHI